MNLDPALDEQYLALLRNAEELGLEVLPHWYDIVGGTDELRDTGRSVVE